MTAQHPTPFPIRRPALLTDRDVEGLSAVLVDAIEGGASVSFLHPLPVAKARAFWGDVAAAVERGERAVLLAEDVDGIVGTVQLVLDQPENQPHRADLVKLLVHRRARRRGLGAALVRAAEDLARERGRSLLVLDTVTGSDGERLYARLGWERCGVLPGYALGSRGGLCATTVFYRGLETRANGTVSGNPPGRPGPEREDPA